MKEKVKAYLETKFPNARRDFIEAQAAMIGVLAEDEEQAVKMCDKFTAESFLATQKDFRSKVDSEVSNTRNQLEALKKQIAEKEKEPKESTNTQPQPKATTGNENSALLKQIEALRNEMSELKAARLSDTYKAQFETALKDVNKNVKSLMLKNFAAQTFESPEAFNTYLTESVKEATEIQSNLQKEMLGNNGAPIRSVGSDGVSDSLKSYVKEQQNTTSSVIDTKILKTK